MQPKSVQSRLNDIVHVFLSGLTCSHLSNAFGSRIWLVAYTECIQMQNFVVTHTFGSELHRLHEIM